MEVPQIVQVSDEPVKWSYPLQYEAGPINASISARDGADSTYSHVNGTIYTF